MSFALVKQTLGSVLGFAASYLCNLGMLCILSELQWHHLEKNDIKDMFLQRTCRQDLETTATSYPSLLLMLSIKINKFLLGHFSKGNANKL